MSNSGSQRELRRYYETLYRSWGPQHWWPGETRFEVIVGAYLTQNAAWTNVERALANLRNAQLLTVDGIRKARLSTLQRLIRPSGYFRQKAARLKGFVAFLDFTYGGSLERMFASPTSQLRAELLGLNGIGPETADSILLYAGKHAVFVVDAYTRRVLERHEAANPVARYDELRALVEESLQSEEAPVPAGEAHVGERPIAHAPSPMSTATRSPLAQVYNEMHGLLVQAGKHYCLKQEPRCESCPLGAMLPKHTQTRVKN